MNEETSEENFMIFVRGALEVSIESYKNIVALRLGSGHGVQTEKKTRLQREIAKYYLQLGELIAHVHQ